MATTYAVRYKNFCAPQEQHSAGGRYYVDSDMNTSSRIMAGHCNPISDITATGTYNQATIGSTIAVSLGSSKDFVYIKNTGTDSIDLKVSLDGGTKYLIKLSDGEAFASEIDTSASIYVLSLSATTTIEYYTAA